MVQLGYAFGQRQRRHNWLFCFCLHFVCTASAQQCVRLATLVQKGHIVLTGMHIPVLSLHPFNVLQTAHAIAVLFTAQANGTGL